MNSNPNAAASKISDKASEGGVLVKLVVFALSLALFPITVYFTSLRYVWIDNSTYAAIAAVLSANVVLFTYIAASVFEDKSSPSNIGNDFQQPEAKKSQ